jgi:putative membrane protein
LPVWQRLDLVVAIVFTYTLVVCALLRHFQVDLPNYSSVSATLNTIVLGVLLQFRNREAYDRWWEGRRLWGQLVNDSRNICLKVRVLPGVHSADRAQVARCVVGFAVGLRNHLRGAGKLQDVPGYANSSAHPQHVPSFIAHEMFTLAQNWRRGGRISEVDLLILDPHLRAYMDICGACERIRSSPVPQSYRSLLRHGMVLHLISTPWLLTEDLSWGAAPIMAMMTYFLVGIDLTAEDVEEPFGRDGDDLALTRLCEVIQRSAGELLHVPVNEVPKTYVELPRLESITGANADSGSGTGPIAASLPRGDSSSHAGSN